MIDAAVAIDINKTEQEELSAQKTKWDKELAEMRADAAKQLEKVRERKGPLTKKETKQMDRYVYVVQKLNQRKKEQEKNQNAEGQTSEEQASSESNVRPLHPEFEAQVKPKEDASYIPSEKATVVAVGVGFTVGAGVFVATVAAKDDGVKGLLDQAHFSQNFYGAGMSGCVGIAATVGGLFLANAISKFGRNVIQTFKRTTQPKAKM